MLRSFLLRSARSCPPPYALSPTSVKLDFFDNSDNEIGFLIGRQTNGQGPITFFTAPANAGKGPVTFTDTTAQAGTRYNYAVLAFNSLYGSGVAGPVFVTTPAGAASMHAAHVRARRRAHH